MSTNLTTEVRLGCDVPSKIKKKRKVKTMREESVTLLTE